MGEGWVKIHRKLLESAVFTAGDGGALLMVWLWCLFSAEWRQRQTLVGTKVTWLEPGQFVYGRNRAAEFLGIPPSTLYEKMKVLETLGNIRQMSDSRATVVTVVNWTTYQLTEDEGRQMSGSVPTAQRQPSDTITRSKEGKKESDLFGHSAPPTPVRQTKRGNPRPEELALLFPGDWTLGEHARAREIVAAYGRHCAEIREGFSFETVKTLIAQQGADRVLYAMRLLVSKGWRKLSKAFEWMKERIDDPKVKDHYAKFVKELHER